MSYNVLSHSHWGMGQFFRGGFVEIPGGSKNNDSFPILGLQRVVSLILAIQAADLLFSKRLTLRDYL